MSTRELQRAGERWQDFARCKAIDPNTFFPGEGYGAEIAKKICAECVVIEPCLEFALSERIDHGVWGGESERGRRQILRRRRVSDY